MNHRNVIFKRLLPIAFVVIGVITINTCNNFRENSNEKELLLKSLNDTIQHYRDKDGINKARISVLETSNLDYFTSLVIRDREIKNLQDLVAKNKKNLKSATVIKTETKIDTVIKVVEKLTDDVRKSRFNFDDWVYGEILSFPDSIGIDLRIKNNISILHKKDKKGSYVEVFDTNPFSTTESIRSYYKPDKSIKKSNWSLGVNASYGVNYKGEFMPYIGIGINRDLISF